MRLNVKLKATIVKAAITATFEPTYEAALEDVRVEVLAFVISKSKHEAFMALNLDTETLQYVQGTASVRIHSDVYTGDLPFAPRNWLSAIRLGQNIYGADGNYVYDEDIESLRKLRELVKSINVETKKLTSCIGEYTTVKKLVQDLPWAEQYLPWAEQQQSTALISVDTLNSINSLYGA